MTYNLPKNIPLPPELDNKAKGVYSRMAVAFDNEFYTENRDDTKLYQYLYFIIYMLASKKRYFVGAESLQKYDSFALFSATTLYMRFIKKQQNGEKIKSVLNYCKKTLYGLKTMYQNDTFSEVFSLDLAESHNLIENLVQDSYYKDRKDLDLKLTFADITYFFKKAINESPYKDNQTIINNIYISVLLSFLKNLKKDNKNMSSDLEDIIITNSIKNQNNLILWHLDNSYTDYINMLLNKIKTSILKEIKTIKDEAILTDKEMQDILVSAYQLDDSVV